MVLVALAPLALPTAANAQDLEPRAYANTPIGVNFVLAGYSYTTGDVTTDPSLPLEDAEVRVHNTLFAYARSFALLGESAKVDVVLPYSWASGSATFLGVPQQRDVNGFGDPRFRISVNLYGAPALSLEDFASYHQDLIVGFSLQTTVPLGRYDADKLLNIGTNRWSFKPEVGVSKAFGPLIVELAPSATFYTDNDAFLGGLTRAQDPLFALQAHVIYSFGRALWGALDGTFYRGGRTNINGVENDDVQQSTRLGGTIALSVNRYNSLKLYGSTGLTSTVGGDFSTVGIAWQFRWGGGL